MQLIKTVEVAYFRSFLKEKVTDLEDLNIFFGRNDSGKSNVLRALNLFFNQQTNPNLGFDFALDFNNQRRSEAGAGTEKRKFVYIKVTFRTPTNYKSSLGDEFSVKRQWNVSRGESFHQEISKNVPQARHQYVTRLLNQMRFQYIPAVKDRRIFSWLFQQIYGIIVGNSDFSKALDRFAAEIQQNTDHLFKDLEPVLGFKSALAPPSNLTELFGALDVETASDLAAQSLSLILQRGDGVQVRHIPEILKFISDRGDGQFHLWGFEEPENSLELAFAFDEAKRFLEISGDANKQLFVTSHSPSFFTINGDRCAKFFVGRNEGLSRVKPVVGNDENEALELMGDSFYLPMISRSIKKAMEDVDAQKQSILKLNADLSMTTGPILFVEGTTDAEILELAHTKLFGVAPSKYLIRAAGGTQKMSALIAEGSALSIVANQRKIFVLTDNDFDGRKLAKNSSIGKWRAAKNGTLWWMLKPTIKYHQKMVGVKLKASMYFFCIEDCFSFELRRVAKESIVKIDSECKYNAGRDYPEKIDHADLITLANQDQDLRFCVFAPDKDAKGQFSEWLQQQPPAQFEYFREFFVELEKHFT